MTVGGSSNGSIADIDGVILEETIFAPNGEELTPAAKSLTASKRQGVRSVESLGQGEGVPGAVAPTVKLVIFTLRPTR
jgi:hypothetical protein